jgi:alanine racemase
LTDTAEARLAVDLDALAANFRLLQETAGTSEVAPVVKADAYGLGAEPVAGRLWAEGARAFFVARVAEGEQLRAALGPGRPSRIYVLDGLPPGTAIRLATAGLTPVLNSPAQVEEAAAFASAARRPLEAALHIDTGLNRLGLRPEEARALVEAPGRLAGLELVLVMSHLACAADPDHPMNVEQLERFEAAAALFPGVPRSLANSGGIFLGPDYHFDLVRPGVTLYGGGPRERHDPRIRPVALLDAPIVQVRALPPGESVGYDATFTAKAPMRVAIVLAGHADGYLRAGAGRAKVWFDGAFRSVLGSVSMDLLAIDVTGCEAARPGARVELVGPHALVDEVAAAAGTISYEVLVRMGDRAVKTHAPALAGEGAAGEGRHHRAGHGR